MSKFIGWDFFEGLISWVMGYNQNELNYARQAAENQKNRDFAAFQQRESQTFNANQAELAYDRMEEFYEKHQSLPARMREYEQAGMNPVLAAGASPVSPTSVPSASSSPAGASTSALPQVMDLANMILNIKQKQAETRKTENEADLTGKEVSWYDALRGLDLETGKAAIEKVKSDIQLNSAMVSEIAQKIKESMKRVDEMDSTISLNGALVDLHGSAKELNQARRLVENLNAKSLEKCLPYIEARQEAEIALANAQGKEATAAAEQRLYEANLSFLKVMVESDLIEGGYYDSVMENIHWSAKQAKRAYKWAPINDVCSNASYLMMGIGSAAGGTGSVLPFVPKKRNPIGY